jgi:patatin-like phospholipase/acyl hydrolase
MSLDRKIRVLTIDGGGIRGIISAQLLVNIEQQLQDKFGENFKLGDYFDIVAGTSTGGIITSLLLLKDDEGNLIYDTTDIVNLYLHNNQEIFKKNLWHRIKTLFGVFGAEFENDGFEELLEKYLGNKELKDLSKPSVILAYDTYKRTCVLFKQHYAINDPSHNFYLKDVVRATSSAPTYFRPVKIHSFTNEEYTLVDGGVYANNPSMCAFVEINKIFKKENGDRYDIQDIKILSIGTGIYDIKYPWYKIKKWGLVKWIKPFIDVSMSATNEVTDYQIRKMFEYSDCPDGYLRINLDLNATESSIDNIKKTNLNKLKILGDKIFLINKDKIKKFIEL